MYDGPKSLVHPKKEELELFSCKSENVADTFSVKV